MRKPRVTDPPARIFLTVGDLDFQDEDFKALDEVCWSSHKEFDADIEYRLVKPAKHRKRPAPTAEVKR